jgi:hypothetical protein
MPQRQLRLGDILDDYCPRERRVTNHAVVAMVGDDVKQTRCTTCDADHEYKHARVPRQRRKGEAPAALFAQVAAGAPRRIAPESPNGGPEGMTEMLAADGSAEPQDAVAPAPIDEPAGDTVLEEALEAAEPDDVDDDEPQPEPGRADEGFHRRLIRASLPRPEGQQPPARPIPEFTIRQPGGGRPNRFRPRPGRGGGAGSGGGQAGHQFGGTRSNGNMAGPMRGPRPGGGRPGGGGGMNRRGPGGRKRSK